ncbi:phytanoyl-CoA dioxygenase family protein [Paenibacillus kobensis]|uniref:phytanoyl-CoA dioxygenase family protein n=1 Tax=Paenibacillus kobensis TaxID=59841 RepID=UPI000FD9B64B|nr:phytanoyl-CoA dioxygenase family protein [Paenibacillus kobensis]
MSVSKLTIEDKRFYEENGYLIVRKVFLQNDVDELNERFRQIWLDLVRDQKIKQDIDRPLDSLFSPLRDFHREDDLVKSFILDKRVIELLENLLGEAPLAIVSNYHLKPPGAEGMGNHQDNYNIGVSPDTTHAVWVSLDKADPQNGSMYFYKGTGSWEIKTPDSASGAWGEGEHLIVEGQETIELVTEPGDIIIFNGQIVHASHPNQSLDRYRRAIITHYARSSSEKTYLNFNQLLDKEGNRVRRRLNSLPGKR